MYSETAESPRNKSVLSRFIASILAAVLSVAGLVALGPAAYAATPGISVTSLHNNSPVSDGAVVEPGDTFTLRVQYNDAVDASSPIVVGLPTGVTLDDSSLEVPAGNTAIQDISLVDGNINITFYDTEEWGDVNQGVWDLKFAFDSVEYTESQQIEWTINGDPTTLDVVVRVPGDNNENVSNSINKSAGWVNLNQYVSVDEDGNVVLGNNITEQKINYTLNVNTDRNTERSAFEISDEISPYLDYNADFSAQITTWDENGWNQTTENFDFAPTISGNAFSASIDLPNPSQLRVTYSASVSPDALDDFRAALQTQYEALEGGYGNYSVQLGNTAIFGDAGSREANVNVGGSITEPAPAPGPNIGQAFGKSGDWAQQNIEPAEDGSLESPLDITYSFTANLSQWNGEAAEGHDNHEDFELDRNVVISDRLPAQVEWNTSSDDFITVEGMELTEAAGFDGDAAAFAADEYVSQYAVVGQSLYINVGQSADTNATVSAKALITTLDGIWPWEQPNTGFIFYALKNSATFTYSDGNPHTDEHEVNLVDRGDTSGGVNDPNRFSKNAQSDGIEYVDIGESLTIDYQFIVEGVDVTNSYIVDERDGNIFDFSDEATLAEIQESITGQHSWWVNMGSEHFDVSVNEDGNLVVRLSDDGVDMVGEGFNGRLVVNLPLTTVEFDSKQTVNIKNHATLYGSDDEALYWSETTSEASSFGNEAEVRKSIRDSANGEWTQNLRVEIGEDGELIQDEYVYNLAFIPHGNYSAVTISPVLDELPDEVEFLGFVTNDNVDSGDNPVEGPQDIGGNLEAVYDADTHTVTVQQKDGTLLEQQPNISANVLVRIVKFEEDVPVANFFGNSSTIYTPSDGYPISIAKVDSEDDEVVIDDPNSRFRVLDSEDNVVIENVFVENGQLRALTEQGNVTGLVVREPGIYYVEETVAPEGYELSEQRIQVTVNEDGSSSHVTFPNVPTEEQEDPEPAVSIVKGDGDAEAGTIENDANTEDDAVAYADGETRDIVITVENTGNEDLVDVVLTDETQSGSDIENLVWTLPNGDTIEATTDEDGVLTAAWDGPWAVGDTITGVATLTLAAGEELHTNLASVDAAGAASGTPVEDDDPYNATPPEQRTYAIGDYVWIDANNNGVQDDGEEPLADVTVVLFDGEGSEIDRTETNSDGRYIFDNLEAGDYQVRFILTDEQAAIYEFTDSTVGDDVEVDSDAGFNGFSSTTTLGEDNAFLTSNENYEHFTVEATEGIDPTWDAGVVLLPVPEEPTYAIGDYVWIDTNRDGIQDDDESPLNDVTVVLYDSAGEELDRTTTNAAGRYIFDNLEAGEYSVGFELTEEQAERYEFTLYTAEEDVEVDSDAGEQGRSGVIILGEDNEFLTSNENYEHNTVQATEGIDPTWDAGVVEILNPELDVAKNEAGDDEHQVVAGEHDVVVTVTNAGNEALEDFAFEDTTEDGHDVVWNEEDLAGLTDLVLEPGDSYTVNGVVQVDAGQTHRDNVVVDANGVISGDPVEDEDPTTYHADPTYAIGDYVWVDTNRDGIQDENENPLADVTVVLYDGEGEEIYRTTTDENGRYIFDNLPSGDYQVGFELTEEQERQYNFTSYTEGDDPASDSNAGENGRSAVFTLGEDSPLTSDDDYEFNTVEASEGIDPTWDAGVVEKTYAIGDYVWVDEDRDGVQDEGENPLADVTVVLYDGDGEEIDRTTTDENGRYIFDNLPSGDYQVGFELTEEQNRQYNFTSYTEGDDPALDSNAGENGRSAIFTLGPDNPLVSDNDYEFNTVEASEGIDPTWDAGVQLKPYAIGDYVWIDTNRDGIQDEGEEPLEGVTVILYDGDTNEIARTTTDENGRYLFDYLNAGDYEVRFILTEEQAELYEFTKLREGSDSKVDSNAGYLGFSGVFALGSDNQNLTLDYEYQEFGAALGIDPTWDAGVVLIPEKPVDPTPTPSEPTKPGETPDASDPSDPKDPSEESPGDKDGELSRTGANFAQIFGMIGLLLLGTGGALYARHRKSNES
ncbi:SdrD B-like domain-containing protein [Enteractinococcus helveticum]|uniref:SdrD B-like domain-containing protein n=1 Tax=Enteractinococcus helveticum TaxID=1837282 RepID=UPI001372C298|nr:SdrD B-like domain-containing protein [Enteractinococcus helveticum]